MFQQFFTIYILGYVTRITIKKNENVKKLISVDKQSLENCIDVIRKSWNPQQRFNLLSQMSYNVIFPVEPNFPIRSRYVFYFMFCLTFKAFVMFVIVLLFQNTLDLVLARGKGPKNSVHRDLFDTKNPKQKTPRPSAAFYEPYSTWIGLQPN